MSQTIRFIENTPENQDLEIGPLINYLILDAVDAKASDIHIEPWESSLVVRIRVSGVLQELVHLSLNLMEKVSGRLKVMADLVIYQSDLPQEGHIPPDPDFGGVQLRVSFFPTVRGEKIVMRIFDPSDRSFRLEDLGFEDSTLEVFRHQLDRPNGLILLTGPTGSGKTTAIYSALHYLIDKWGPSFSLSTVEDPVEFNLPMISQAQINNAKGFTYPMALRSLMRQDPQVIMIGEIRDPETANFAVQAGLTGHLVISTIHSGSTTGVFARLINMELEPFLLASSVCSVLGLRLVRTICPYCIEPYLPDFAILETLPQEWVEATEFYHGVGCVHCLETGFGGRVAVTEMLVVQESLRDGVLKRLPTRQLQEIAVKEGMKTLWEMGLRRVQDRETTLEEVLRVIAVDSPLRGKMM